MIPINSFDPLTLLLIALLNPATILIGTYMGHRADQWQKLPIAAFSAAISGFLLYWVLAFIGLFSIHALGGEAALLSVGFMYGLAWSILGYVIRPENIKHKKL